MSNVNVGRYENPEQIGYRGWIKIDSHIIFTNLDNSLTYYNTENDQIVNI